MSELHIQELLDYYQEDIEDYQRLLKLMNEFERIIDEEQNKEKKTILSQENNISADNKAIVEALNIFSSQREEWFAKIMDRKKVTDDLVRKIDRNDQKSNKLFVISKQLSSLSNEIVLLDERIIAKLKNELEFVKLELKRLEDSKKAINVYAKKNVAEPRFIDKIK